MSKKPTIEEQIIELASKLIDNKRTLATFREILSMMTTMGSRSQALTEEPFWTHSIPLDYVAGKLNPGSRIHLAGPASSGKTALLIHLAQSLIVNYNVSILYIDTLYSVSKDVFEGCGLTDATLSHIDVAPTNRISILENIVTSYDVVLLDDAKGVRDSDNLPSFLKACKSSKTLVVAGDQVRDNMKGGKVPGVYKLLPLFDISLYIQRTEKRSKYIISTLKVVRHRKRSSLKGRRVAVPIQERGLIDTKRCTNFLEQLLVMYPEVARTDLDIVEKIYHMIMEDMK